MAVLRPHENCCRFATLFLEHLGVHREVVHFGIKRVAEVVAERQNVVQEKYTDIEVLPVVDLCKK